MKLYIVTNPKGSGVDESTPTATRTKTTPGAEPTHDKNCHFHRSKG